MALQPVRISCTATGQPVGPLDWQCDGRPVWIDNLPPFDARAIQAEVWSLWRYAAMLPAEPRCTLGEGLTPLVSAQFETVPYYAKLEYLNPTGSYKDRGVSVMVNHLLAQGVSEVIEDSSGNAGASLAAFAAATGIRARIFVPASAPEGKKRLITAFGAETVEIPGPRAATTAACLEAARVSVYATHAWSPFFIAGQMTCAWEIWEQLGHRAPDGVVCPIGQGGLFLGLYHGFQALRAAGLIDRLPRLFGVQAAACAPIVRAWERGLERPELVEQQPSAADGIATTRPVRGSEILAAIRATDGAAFQIDEPAIQAAQRVLHHAGFIVEPTSAVAPAALPAVQRLLGRNSTLVVPLTGNGLKTLSK